MVDLIDEYFVKPMRFPEDYAPYNPYNTAVYAVVALLAAYLIFRWLKAKKIPVAPQFYYSLLPFIFLGAVMRVIQDASILPRSLELSGIAIYPFISPGIYVLMFLLLAIVYFVARRESGGDHEKLQRRIRNAGIGLGAALFAVLAIYGFSKIRVENVLLLLGILAFALIGLLLFELIKKKIYNKGEKPELKTLERTTLLSQSLDGAATFAGVAFGGYSEQHVVANTIFSIFGSPLAFYAVKLLFALSILFVLRREAESREEHIYILLLVTIFGLAPGVRDSLRLLFGV